jgi:hypothetical protein
MPQSFRISSGVLVVALRMQSLFLSATYSQDHELVPQLPQVSRFGLGHDTQILHCDRIGQYVGAKAPTPEGPSTCWASAANSSQCSLRSRNGGGCGTRD